MAQFKNLIVNGPIRVIGEVNATALYGDGTSLVNVPVDYSQGILPISKGGTGASTAENALTNLGASPAVHSHSNYATKDTVTTSTNGLMSSSDKSKLDGINSVSLLNLLYPIGSIYETTSSSLDTIDKMNAHFGGTWEEFARGSFLIGANSLYAVGDTTYGSNNASVVSHSHDLSGTAKSGGAHGHGVSFWCGDAGYHDHAFTYAWEGWGWGKHVTYNSSTWVVGRDTGGCSTEGSHNHPLWVSVGSNGSHSHSIDGSVSATGSSGTNLNIPLSYAVYRYKRVA